MTIYYSSWNCTSTRAAVAAYHADIICDRVLGVSDGLSSARVERRERESVASWARRAEVCASKLGTTASNDRV